MTLAGDFACKRCGRPGERLERPPLPGLVGRQILESTCSSCWHEWRQEEVRVINELRLNFIEAESQRTLERHLREYLCLPPA